MLAVAIGSRLAPRDTASDNRSKTIDPFSALQTLAEIAIAVAGFSGIISIYQRVNRAQNELARWRIYTVLSTSFYALFMATFPMGLALLEIEEQELWRQSSAVGFVLMLMVYADLLRSRKKLSRASVAVIEKHPWYSRVTTLLGLSIGFAHFVNAFVDNNVSSAAVYFFCGLATVAIACIIFVRAVFGPHPSDELPAV